MGKGKIHITPEQLDAVAHWLPRGVALLNGQVVGGAVEYEIEGSTIEDGDSYHIAIFEDGVSRTAKLQKSQQEIGVSLDRNRSLQERKAPVISTASGDPDVERLKAELSKFDHDGDGKVGGSKPKRKAKTRNA